MQTSLERARDAAAIALNKVQRLENSISQINGEIDNQKSPHGTWDLKRKREALISDRLLATAEYRRLKMEVKRLDDAEYEKDSDKLLFVMRELKEAIAGLTPFLRAIEKDVANIRRQMEFEKPRKDPAKDFYPEGGPGLIK